MVYEFFRDSTDQQLVRSMELATDVLGPDGQWRAFQYDWSSAPLYRLTPAEAREMAGPVDLTAPNA
jgi:hypothetical protein